MSSDQSRPPRPDGPAFPTANHHRVAMRSIHPARCLRIRTRAIEGPPITPGRPGARQWGRSRLGRLAAMHGTGSPQLASRRAGRHRLPARRRLRPAQRNFRCSSPSRRTVGGPARGQVRSAPRRGSCIPDEAARRNANQKHPAYRLLLPKSLPNSLPTPVTSAAISVTGLSHPRISSPSAFESDRLPAILRGSRFLCGRLGSSFHNITLPPRGVGVLKGAFEFHSGRPAQTRRRHRPSLSTGAAMGS